MYQTVTITTATAEENENVVYETASKQCHIAINEELGYIQLHMEGKVEVEEYKEVMEKLLQIALPLPYTHVIYDIKGLTNTDPRARAWYVGTFLPKATKTLDRDLRSAMIQPSSLFQRMAVNTITKAMKAMGVKAETKYFDDKQSALDWLY